MKQLFVLVFILFSFSCAENNSIKMNDFEEVIEGNFLNQTKHIKQLTFPYKINCYTKYDYTEVNKAFIKYQPEGGNLVGIVFSNNIETAILYTFSSDVVFPVVYIYSNEGNVDRIINVLNLHDCGFDEKEEMYVNCILFSTEIIKNVEVNDLVKHTKTLNTDTIKLINN